MNNYDRYAIKNVDKQLYNSEFRHIKGRSLVVCYADDCVRMDTTRDGKICRCNQLAINSSGMCRNYLSKKSIKDNVQL